MIENPENLAEAQRYYKTCEEELLTAHKTEEWDEWYEGLLSVDYLSKEARHIEDVQKGNHVFRLTLYWGGPGGGWEVEIGHDHKGRFELVDAIFIHLPWYAAIPFPVSRNSQTWQALEQVVENIASYYGFEADELDDDDDEYSNDDRWDEDYDEDDLD